MNCNLPDKSCSNVQILYLNKRAGGLHSIIHNAKIIHLMQMHVVEAAVNLFVIHEFD